MRPVALLRVGAGPAGRLRARAAAGAAAGVAALGAAGCARARAGRRLRKKVSGTLSKSSVEKIFDDLDRDKSGEIDEEEIRQGLKRLGLPSGDDYVSDLLEGGYDLDSSKTISRKEFVAYVKDKEQAMLKVFKGLDKDGSGTISTEEIVEVMSQMGISASGSDGRRMVDLLDENKDGVVTFEEFHPW